MCELWESHQTYVDVGTEVHIFLPFHPFHILIIRWRYYTILTWRQAADHGAATRGNGWFWLRGLAVLYLTEGMWRVYESDSSRNRVDAWAVSFVTSLGGNAAVTQTEERVLQPSESGCRLGCSVGSRWNSGAPRTQNKTVPSAADRSTRMT